MAETAAHAHWSGHQHHAWLRTQETAPTWLAGSLAALRLEGEALAQPKHAAQPLHTACRAVCAGCLRRSICLAGSIICRWRGRNTAGHTLHYRLGGTRQQVRLTKHAFTRFDAGEDMTNQTDGMPVNAHQAGVH
jgi:hypothetical protein